jgi:hypothetical protein
MTQGMPSNSGQSENLLNRVHEGMDVYSYDDEYIGEVEWIYFGSVGVEGDRAGAGPVTPDDPRMRQRNFIDDIADVFRDDDMPDQFREHLMRVGFIRINASGLFARDRYATPDQISAVRDDRVILTANRDTLIKG